MKFHSAVAAVAILLVCGGGQAVSGDLTFVCGGGKSSCDMTSDPANEIDPGQTKTFKSICMKSGQRKTPSGMICGPMNQDDTVNCGATHQDGINLECQCNNYGKWDYNGNVEAKISCDWS
ncbi:hypothetical protein [Bauldia sp.]|uniref:hypothetical protein n=1 Tax=Bauldia sp. TaxID=2575872 RepID=UPI003BAA80B5